MLSQILRKAQQRGMLVPNLARLVGANGDGGVAYEGATVLEAKAGFYEQPIATLDFASLYPSIMMAHNLCYCTLVPRGQAGGFAAEDVTRSPCGDTFVRPHLARGILPEILQELLGARKRAKADLKKATDPFERAVLDGRQLALKARGAGHTGMAPTGPPPISARLLTRPTLAPGERQQRVRLHRRGGGQAAVPGDLGQRDGVRAADD